MNKLYGQLETLCQFYTDTKVYYSTNRISPCHELSRNIFPTFRVRRDSHNGGQSLSEVELNFY